jgi:hypothetical protein
MELDDFINNAIKNNIKIFTIIDKLIKNFGYSINNDSVENDVRTVILNNFLYGNIKIVCKKLYKKDSLEIIEYSELYHKYYNEIKKYEIY